MVLLDGATPYGLALELDKFVPLFGGGLVIRADAVLVRLAIRWTSFCQGSSTWETDLVRGAEIGGTISKTQSLVPRGRWPSTPPGRALPGSGQSRSVGTSHRFPRREPIVDSAGQW